MRGRKVVMLLSDGVLHFFFSLELCLCYYLINKHLAAKSISIRTRTLPRTKENIEYDLN